MNLAVADVCFLVGMPFLVTTMLLKRWIFGDVMCRIFMILTSINWFTSVFTLTVMSADRYLAVCHPIRSMNYRTPLIASIVCACVWALSMAAMIPIALYSTTRTIHGQTEEQDFEICTIKWRPIKYVHPAVSRLMYVSIIRGGGVWWIYSCMSIIRELSSESVSSWYTHVYIIRGRV